MDMEENKSTERVNSPKKRKFLGIYFVCCNVYAQIYNNSGKYYEGRCPCCLRRLTVRIGKNGVKNRFFTAS
ncbi:MAG: hypothetical protein SCARUB_04756 [Candidatus Scalindua rubra]|uniref:Uncharacterized protein n=1 Tax=Candidatus Scalindua rubra TaxID=1872076 RepID=A0A1E3X3E8_9BACT|nr:MAG: hypothetical protein SCARUB_04756 [Candidatus Scalindua rubra]